MTEPVRAILMDLEGAAVPMTFMTETLTPLASKRLGGYIAQHPSDPEVEDALEETGRLMVSGATAPPRNFLADQRHSLAI